ncbi:hypothetical protein FB451DRAFT_1182232 [Mycena latifolia]|nr:hypothetical protein FB451DRAFT_1182232 [Mycena latifolia]
MDEDHDMAETRPPGVSDWLTNEEVLTESSPAPKRKRRARRHGPETHGSSRTRPSGLRQSDPPTTTLCSSNLRPQMIRMNVAGKARIEQLEYELAAAKALADKQAEMTRLLQEEYTTLAEEFHECQVHENQLEGQFMNDQFALSGVATTMVESQNQLMTQNRAIERLTRDVVDHTNENLELRARIRAPSGPSSHTPRKGRAAKFPVLRNVSATVQIPLDPAPLPDPPALSSARPQDASPCTAEETIYKALQSLTAKSKVTVKLKKQLTKRKSNAEPVAPDDENYWNRELRKKTYKVFRENKQFDFMSHAPVSPEEMKASIIPKENDWRWDFSEGYRHSRWNNAIIVRIVDMTLADQVKEMAASVDPKWLEKQVQGQMIRAHEEWARLKPRALPGGGLETAEQAIARAVAYLAKRNDSHKSTSAKTRKFETRLLTITVTIEIKVRESALDLGTWRRLLKALEYLQSAGMSSEEEDEVEYEGKPMKIFKVKVCMWRAPEIADYMRFIDKQTEGFDTQHRGPTKVVRKPTNGIGRSPAPKGLPECLYNTEWLKELNQFEVEALEVSEEAFALLVAATSRMV